MGIRDHRHILRHAVCGAAFLALAGCATYPVGVNEAVYGGGYYGGPAYYDPGYYNGGFVGGFYGYRDGWYGRDGWQGRPVPPPPAHAAPPPPPAGHPRPWFAPAAVTPHPAPAAPPAGHPKPWFAP